MKKVLFYASVSDLELFKIQSFYKYDIHCLENIGFQVETTNRCFDFLKFWNYDASFLYFYRKSLLPAVISSFFRKKVVFTGGVDDLALDSSTKNFNIQRALINFCYLFADSFLVVSDSDFLNIKKALFTSKLSKLILSYHSIDILQNFNPYREMSCQSRCCISTICWMGSKVNVQRKGVDKALYIFKEWLEKKPNLNIQKFYIIGRVGSGTDYLKEVIAECGLDDYVEFTGAISDIEKNSLLLKSRFYFQCSQYEGFGVAALEALYNGCLVIHPGNGGLSSTISSYGIQLTTLDVNNAVTELIELDAGAHEVDYESITAHLNKFFSHDIRSKSMKSSFNL